MSTYIPYFYIIQHISSGKYYCGVKYGIYANPDKLLTDAGYQTSSEIVKEIILEEGLDSFIIRKIRVFETAEAALNYETRFLRRINAAYNDDFLNRSNNSLNALNVDFEKRKRTCLDKYGVENPFQAELVKEKIKQTCLENHGYEYPLQVPEIKEKIKQINLEKYGCEYSFQSKEIQEKIKQTCLENHGYEYPFQAPKIQEKIRESYMEKYGCDNPSQVPEIREKQKQTCLERYCYDNPSQVPEIKEKKKQTCLENFGCEYSFQSKEIQEKIKQTCLQNYGCENPSQAPEIQKKKKITIDALIERPILSEIRKYRDTFQLKLGSKWFWKKQEILDNMLEELKTTYGELE